MTRKPPAYPCQRGGSASGQFPGKQAVEAELEVIAQKATTLGSLLNKVLTKTP
jgi:hypothetical protein